MVPYVSPASVICRPQSQPRKPRTRIPNLPEWGKDLPEDVSIEPLYIDEIWSWKVLNPSFFRKKNKTE